MGAPRPATLDRSPELVGQAWYGDHVTVKVITLVTVPAFVLTVMGPDVAPAGTVTRREVPETVLISAGVDPNRTVVAVPSACPLMVTVAPGGPDCDEKPVMDGVTDVVIRPMEFVN